MYFLKCEIRGCRQESHLVPCKSCQRLVCPAHSTPVGYGERRCYGCAKPAHKCAQPAQLELFSRVRPRSKRPALDGLV